MARFMELAMPVPPAYPGFARFGMEGVSGALDDKGKKQVPLRLSASLWKELVIWAQEDFRSLNCHIEYLLNESVKRRRKGKPAPPP